MYTVVILDTLQTGFAIHNAWQVLGSGWGTPSAVLKPEWSWGSVPLFTGIGVCPSFFDRVSNTDNGVGSSFSPCTRILCLKDFKID